MIHPTPYMTWSELHKIGIEEIDLQHEWMVNDFNSAMTCIQKIDDREVVLKMLDVFVRTTKGHFGDEEQEMVRVNFPDLEVHRERHNNYLDRILALRERYERGISITDDMISYFISWTSHHVAVTDQKFGDFLKKIAIPSVDQNEFR